ncbi:MAG TPA: response regulator [Candidatus Binatia bacterium]|jgi:CheY-like chemotaxis protein|nr:response regulator [Candidatus Binatia bacterium]
MDQQAPILVVDDDDNDVFLLRRALTKAGVHNPLFVARDGQEAIDYLAGAAPYSDRGQYPLPALLLLDLKMPRVNGFDVLAWKERRPQLRQLPVVVFSSSSQAADQARARTMGAVDYHAKPADFQELVRLLKNLHERWLGATGPK